MRDFSDFVPTDGPVQGALDQWLAALTPDDASPQTIRRYATVVRDFIAWYAGAYGEPLAFPLFTAPEYSRRQIRSALWSVTAREQRLYGVAPMTVLF